MVNDWEMDMGLIEANDAILTNSLAPLRAGSVEHRGRGL
jgi:hypothetical protein